MTANDFNYDQMRREECQKLIPRVFHIEMPVDEFLFDDIRNGARFVRSDFSQPR